MGSSKKFEGIVTKLGLEPMESPVMTENKQAKLTIGIPKERKFQEHRIALTPEAVKVLVANGHRIIIQSNAGLDSSYFDADFSEAGAEIAMSADDVYKSSEVILKIAPPDTDEIELMHPNQTLISPIHLPTIKRDYITKLSEKRVNAIAFEYIKDQSGYYPVVHSMSEIAGNSAILIAAEYLSNANDGKGILLGGISGVPPAKVVIIGAGSVGISAARAALGLGAIVSVFDISIFKLQRLQEKIGTRVFTAIISPQVLENELMNCDVAIGAIHAKNWRTAVVITEETVMKMKAGSVIIDVSIDQGGCFETSHITSHAEPIYKKHDVIHYCVPNIPSRFSRTASNAISNILTPMLLKMGELQGVNALLYEDAGIRNGVYLYNGNLTNQYLAGLFNLKHTNLDLLFAANF